MTAREAWTLQAVDYRGGVVGELDIKADCADGRTGTITVFRFPAGWRVQQVPKLPACMERAVLRIAREAVELGCIA
ncbi:hypothetical protein AWC11_23205 [Mycobacterium interjectum]|nr:hypothetical protein AWC11_23205 [Mycobacterium interjectum]